ncbi:MAG TPA: YhbY family RNA-binding protein [Candidatus Onthovivens sp.]|nr:YhbY family RNA-binding protein [Candidatus Onthovivens sp.]
MLKTKEKVFLKSYANSHEILKFNIGKELTNENVINNLKNGIFKHELIKVSLLKGAVENVEKEELFEEIAKLLNAEIIHKIGNTAIFYKENIQSPKHIKVL